MKKKEEKKALKKQVTKMVEKDLTSLLVKLDPKMGEKKSTKRIKRAGRILIKGMKINVPEITGDLKEAPVAAK
jgi:hypothetical protein